MMIIRLMGLAGGFFLLNYGSGIFECAHTACVWSVHVCRESLFS